MFAIKLMILMLKRSEVDIKESISFTTAIRILVIFNFVFGINRKGEENA